MIRHNRISKANPDIYGMQAGRTNSPIYGIATDSWDWYFLRLDPNGVVSAHVVLWHNDSIEVISLIHKIIDQATCLTPVSSQALPTVEESSSLHWLPEIYHR
ncbi:hypothetical protein ASPVEDRAFT_79194 [Aspergillus versicolor CBS 583.65]|uniref:Uncharacterized protein n=1 Tax=Aspergillus versicolor CBS 583.65 TaxID=1036611 RepID=A0A1L9P7J9_ASPVE|nr:uncharacterized protein ASPVEDRAFT_79194 [Aspergillus versicolor CBS 583.65]OJI97481.1 hypothetical protein ASPVEDRAFT_79194 [Aspergillus versicolor CBS 583.65]